MVAGLWESWGDLGLLLCAVNNAEFRTSEGENKLLQVDCFKHNCIKGDIMTGAKD